MGDSLSERQNLFDHLWTTSLGRCFIHNLLDSVHLGTLDQSIASTALDECGDVLKRKPSSDGLDELPRIVLGLGAYLGSPVKPTGLPEYLATSFDAQWAIAPLSTHPDRRLTTLPMAISDFYI